MTWLAAPALAAAAYYAVAIVAALRWRRARSTASASLPPVSILKPVRGREPRFYEAIRSHAAQDYPGFEILFGVTDPDDPAISDIRRLMAEFPALPIELVIQATEAPNQKVGTLAGLAARARFPLLLVNDSDIRVEPDYLRRVVAGLENARTGLVTCLYRARGDSRAARWEALGIATEFVPSVLVARFLGAAEFALGSTMLLRSEHLRAIGGFSALQNYLADDYQLGRRITELGQRVEFSTVVVETDLGKPTWKQAWLHQLRWARTVRVSRPGGYYGYAVTQASAWALLALAGGAWPVALLTLALRMSAALLAGRLIGDPRVPRYALLIPLRDLWGLAIWIVGAFGNSVAWRGTRLQLRSDGTIQS